MLQYAIYRPQRPILTNTFFETKATHPTYTTCVCQQIMIVIGNMSHGSHLAPKYHMAGFALNSMRDTPNQNVLYSLCAFVYRFFVRICALTAA